MCPVLLLYWLLAQALEIEQCFNECLTMANQLEQEMDTELARYMSRASPCFIAIPLVQSVENGNISFRNYTFVM